MSVSERRDPLHRLDPTLRGFIRLADRLSERVRRVRRCQSASDGGRGPAGGRVAAEGRRGRGGQAIPDRSETVRLLNRSARVRFYLGQSSCLGCRAELAADRIFIKAAINRGAENGFETAPPLKTAVGVTRLPT